MKKIFFIGLFGILSMASFAQDGVKVEGNSVSTKEIAPVWPGCETSKETSKDCFNKQMNLFIKENFRYPKDTNGNIVRGKTTVAFWIDENGEVTKISAEGPQKPVNDEVCRIVKMFPKMQPGKMGGTTIPVKYKMAFNF